MARNPNGSTSSGSKNGNGSGNLGFEAKLWAAADALRNNTERGRVQACRARSHLPEIHLRRLRGEIRRVRRAAKAGRARFREHMLDLQNRGVQHNADGIVDDADRPVTPVDDDGLDTGSTFRRRSIAA
jgi:hypothetical protein